MKYLLLALFAASLYGCDYACFTAAEIGDELRKNLKPRLEEREVAVIGNTIEAMQKIKYDCEKSLPRDKECVMVFDFVPVEADYE